MSGKWFKVVAYGVRREDQLIDMDEVARIARERILKQLHLKLEKVQPLGDRVMKALRDQVALFCNRKLPCARQESLVLDGHAQVLPDRIKQAPVIGRKRMGRLEMQRVTAQRLSAVPDRRDRDRVKALLAAEVA